MAFCGQCGFLLPPKVTTCPRCNAPVTPGWSEDEQQSDDPTVISLMSSLQQGGGSPPPQQVLPPTSQQSTSINDYNRSTQWDPAMSPPSTNTPPPPPGYSASGTPSLNNISPNANNYPSPPNSASSATPDYMPVYPLPTQKTRRGWIIPVIALLSLLIIVAAAFLIFQPTTVQGLLWGKTPTTQVTPTTPPTTVTQVSPTTPPTVTSDPQQQARSIVEQYYTDINQKDYRSAYKLWVNYPQTYEEFMQGFADTSHDDIFIDSITMPDKYSVQLNITLKATSTTAQQTTYRGYYVVGLQLDGTWKITNAQLK